MKPTSETHTAIPSMASTIIRPLSASDLAPILGIHPVTLLRWAREGRVPHRRLGPRKVIFVASDINKWLLSDSSLYPELATRAAITERMAA